MTFNPGGTVVQLNGSMSMGSISQSTAKHFPLIRDMSHMSKCDLNSLDKSLQEQDTSLLNMRMADVETNYKSDSQAKDSMSQYNYERDNVSVQVPNRIEKSLQDFPLLHDPTHNTIYTPIKSPVDIIDSPFTENLKRENYSPFSLEFKRIVPTQVFEYGQTFSFDIPVVGNMLYRSFLEIELPILYFTDNIIDDSIYVEYKINKLNNIKMEIDYWTNEYTNFMIFASNQISAYSDIIKILKLNNITLDLMKERASMYSTSNSIPIYITGVNIVEYVTGINTMDLYSIANALDSMYNNLLSNLRYYHSNIVYCQEEYNKVKTGEILCKWIDYIGHFYFNYFELNINGIAIDNYSSDYLHIKQSQTVQIDYIDNYNNLIGNTDKIYINKGSPNIIYTPLIFSYATDSTNALPLVGMLNSSIKINSRIDNIKNLLYLQDWEALYVDILTVDIKRCKMPLVNGMITKPLFNGCKVELILPQYIYRHVFPVVTPLSLKYKFPLLIDTEIANIFKYYGSIDIIHGEVVITMDDFIALMNCIRNEPFLLPSTKLILAGYHYMIDYNMVMSQIPKPKVALLMEYGYTDNYEKELVSTSKLNYIIETHHEITLDINSTSLYESLNDITGLVKCMYVFTRPKLYKNGLSQYGKRNNISYNIMPNMIERIVLNIASEYNLFEYYNTSYDSYSYIPPYYYLDAPVPLGVWYRTFSLEPNSIQPSGCVNMNTISGQNVEVIVNDIYTNYYNMKSNSNNVGGEFKLIYVTYNLLQVHDGMAELLYYE